MFHFRSLAFAATALSLAALPFFFLLVAAVAIITIFPQIVMVLPELAFPK